jgi:hypothetical protein
MARPAVSVVQHQNLIEVMAIRIPRVHTVEAIYSGNGNTAAHGLVIAGRGLRRALRERL